MKRRVLMGVYLKNDKAFHGSLADNELDAITRRQTIHVVEDHSLELPPIKRDYRMAIAAVCGIFVSIGFVAALVMAMVASR